MDIVITVRPPQKSFQNLPIKPKDFKTILQTIQVVTATLAEAEGKNTKSTILDNFKYCERDAAAEAKMILQIVFNSC